MTGVEKTKELLRAEIAMVWAIEMNAKRVTVKANNFVVAGLKINQRRDEKEWSCEKTIKWKRGSTKADCTLY